MSPSINKHTRESNTDCHRAEEFHFADTQCRKRLCKFHFDSVSVSDADQQSCCCSSGTTSLSLFSHLLLYMCPLGLDMWHQHTTLLFSFFYSLKNHFAFECPWMFFTLLCFFANVVCFLFFTVTGNISVGWNIDISHSFEEMLLFPPPTADVVQESSLVQGWVTC